MATEAPVNRALPDCGTVVSAAAAAGRAVWQPDPLSMHVVRPKSAKGRTRPRPPQPQDAGVCPHRTPPSPPPALPCASPPPPPSSQEPGACAPRSPSQGAAHEVPELLLLQQVPVGAASSLNRYPVLPSISSRKTLREGDVETVAPRAGSRQLSGTRALCHEEACAREAGQEGSRAAARLLERKLATRTRRQSAPGAGDLEEPSEQEPRLLLAVRSPSGRRFVRHFRPTDALQTVVAVAERQNKASYRPCSIETMEVPRRRFSDLTRSLQECRIPHKSVLGISQDAGERRV